MRQKDCGFKILAFVVRVADMLLIGFCSKLLK